MVWRKVMHNLKRSVFMQHTLHIHKNVMYLFGGMDDESENNLMYVARLAAPRYPLESFQWP
jgi:hypothetical protein